MRTRAIAKKVLHVSVDKWRLRGAQMVRGRREWGNVEAGAKGGREERGDVFSQKWAHLGNRERYNRVSVLHWLFGCRYEEEGKSIREEERKDSCLSRASGMKGKAGHRVGGGRDGGEDSSHVGSEELR